MPLAAVNVKANRRAQLSELRALLGGAMPPWLLDGYDLRALTSREPHDIDRIQYQRDRVERDY